MEKYHMKKIILIIMINLLSIILVRAQINIPDSNGHGKISMGILSGFARTYSDSKIGNHISYNIFCEFPVFYDFFIRIQAEYFETSKHGLWYTLEHQGILYNALTPFIWQDRSIGAGLTYPIIDELSISAGVSAEIITVKWIKYTAENPFIIDESENVILWFKNENDRTLIRPGIFLSTNYNLHLFNQFYLMTGLQYKICFIDKKYGNISSDTRNTYGLFAGVKYRF